MSVPDENLMPHPLSAGKYLRLSRQTAAAPTQRGACVAVGREEVRNEGGEGLSWRIKARFLCWGEFYQGIELEGRVVRGGEGFGEFMGWGGRTMRSKEKKGVGDGLCFGYPNQGAGRQCAVGVGDAKIGKDQGVDI